MKIKTTFANLQAVALLGTFLQIPSFAAVQVTGESSDMDADFAADASAIDLVNSDAPSLASAPTYSSALHFGPAENDGTVGAASASGDISFWLSASAGQQYTITFPLDVSVNTLGYNIESIQTIHGWVSNSGNQKNQNYIVEVSTVDSAAFANLATVEYLPFTPDPQGGSSKVNITEDTTGILASGVDEIRFTYTIPASGGNQPSPTIREIDVFGTPTIGGPDTIPPTLSSIVDDRGGDSVMPNTPVTYTVSFSENMDETTVDSSDFDNAGTAPVTFGAVTETRPGEFTVELTPTATGTLQLRIPAGATLQDAAGNALDTSSDLIDDTILMVETTAPTLVGSDIVDDQAGGPVLQNIALNYTITFSEDMDATTVDASDFDNAGTSEITIGAINESTPGVFTVSLTPTTPGTLQLRIPIGAMLTDAAGNALDTSSAILDDTILTVAPNSVMVIGENSLGTPFDATTWAGNMSATDLINFDQPTLADFTVSAANFGGPNGINDGVSTSSADSIYFAAADKFPATATYNLDVTTNTDGYDITSIESFMGWHANSGTHGNQTYQVEVSFVGSADYINLASVSYDPFGTENSIHHESHIVIQDSSGTLASRVDSIRFTFSSPESGGTAPGTVVREIDVFGEPSSGEALAITDIVYNAEAVPAPTVTLTWRKTGSPSYIVKFSRDLNDWSQDLDDSVAPEQDENPGNPDHITVTFPLIGDETENLKTFFRVEVE